MIYQRTPDRSYVVGIDLGAEGSQISYLNTRRFSSGAEPRMIRNAPARLQNLVPMLTEEIPAEQIGTICCTAKGMDSRMASLVRSAAEEAGLGESRILCEDHLRSFYSYLLQQGSGRPQKDVLLLEGRENGAAITRLFFTQKTSPCVCWPGETENLALTRDAQGDAKLAEYLAEHLAVQDASAVYLAGAFFEGGWLRQTAPVITRGRKAYGGDNLFSRGAVCSALAEAGLVRNASRYYFLSPEALPFHLLLKCRRKYAEISLPLLQAGTLWEEARAEQELLLEGNQVLEFEVRPVTGGEEEKIEVHLDPFPERAGAPTRIRLMLEMRAKNTVFVTVQDMGFGEIFPSSGMKWEKEIVL